MKNHPAYIAARKAKQRAERKWFIVHAGAVALLIGSIALAISSGDGGFLLITIPISLYALFSGMEG